jgi:hypothetical protein
MMIDILCVGIYLACKFWWLTVLFLMLAWMGAHPKSYK